MVMRLIYMLLAFFLCSVLSAENRYALTVFISEYPEESGWNSLNSSNDKEVILPMLSSLGYSDSDIICLEDASATYSNIIEALGALRPVLASDIKGHRDLISDGRSGVLYTPGNTARFVSLAADIFSGRVRLSEAQMKKRYKKFSRETVFDKTYETIKRSFVK